MNCTNCGHTLQDNQNFCGQCGQRIDAGNGTSYHRPQNITETQTSGVSEEELSWFIGKNADVYLGLAERVTFYGDTSKRTGSLDNSHCKTGKKRTRSLFSRFITSSCSPITVSLVV